MPGEIEALMDAIIAGDVVGAISLSERALRKGTPSEVIVKEAMMPAMERVGSDFSQGLAFLPELIAAGHAMSQAVELFNRLPSTAIPTERPQCIVLGTIMGDVHDIGKNIVKITLQGAGFTVIDLGVDVKGERFIEAAREHSADIIGISGLLSATMKNMELAVRQINRELPSKVMVGGASVTQAFADNIGADGYAPDAYLALQKVRALLGDALSESCVRSPEN
jgi:5-methyltetrahydrofolate--homocysteine methyltransferase